MPDRTKNMAQPQKKGSVDPTRFEAQQSNAFRVCSRSKYSGSQSPIHSPRSSGSSPPLKTRTQSSYPHKPPQSSGGKARAPSSSRRWKRSVVETTRPARHRAAMSHRSRTHKCISGTQRRTSTNEPQRHPGRAYPMCPSGYQLSSCRAWCGTRTGGRCPNRRPPGWHSAGPESSRPLEAENAAK